MQKVNKVVKKELQEKQMQLDTQPGFCLIYYPFAEKRDPKNSFCFTKCFKKSSFSESNREMLKLVKADLQ